MLRRLSRWLVLAGTLGLGTSPAALATGSITVAPCDRGTTIAPTVKIADPNEDTHQLTATHPIDVNWSAENSDAVLIIDSYSVSAPSPDEDAASFIPSKPEFRAVARDQVPSAGPKAQVLRFPLCDCDPLFGRIHDPNVVRVGPVRMVISTSLGIRFTIAVKVSTTHTTRFGYDLIVHQGRFRLGRLQAAGTCHFSAGFSNCSVDHFSKPRK
jgi:hypothetical protein